MLKLTILQFYLMTKIIHVPDNIHKKYRRIATDEEITIWQAIEKDLS